MLMAMEMLRLTEMEEMLPELLVMLSLMLMKPAFELYKVFTAF